MPTPLVDQRVAHRKMELLTALVVGRGRQHDAHEEKTTARCQWPCKVEEPIVVGDERVKVKMGAASLKAQELGRTVGYPSQGLNRARRYHVLEEDADEDRGVGRCLRPEADASEEDRVGDEAEPLFARGCAAEEVLDARQALEDEEEEVVQEFAGGVHACGLGHPRSAAGCGVWRRDTSTRRGTRSSEGGGQRRGGSDMEEEMGGGGPGLVKRAAGVGRSFSGMGRGGRARRELGAAIGESGVGALDASGSLGRGQRLPDLDGVGGEMGHRS